MRTEDFKKFNQTAKKVVKKNNRIEQMQYVLFQNGYIYATNDETTIKKRMPDLDGNYPFAILFSEFDKLITKLKNSEIDFTVVENKVKVVTDKGNFTFNSLDEEELNDFPFLQPEQTENFDVIGAADGKLIKKAVNYSAEDELRPVMNTVFVNEHHIVGSDSHLLAFYPVNDDRPGIEYIIPKEVVPLMPDNDVIDVKKGKQESVKLIEFVCNDGFSIISREIEGNYPKYTAVIPTDNPNSFTISEKDVKEVLDLAPLSMNEDGVLKFMSIYDSQRLNISAADIYRGTEYSNTFESEVKGDEMEIYFKHKLLSNLVKTEQAKEYKFEMSGHNRPAIINNEVLLMPFVPKE